MIPVRYVQYSFGYHRIFYIVEGGGDPVFPPTVKCYFPNKNNSKSFDMKRMDIGIYYFEIDFDCQGNHLFVYKEGEQRTGILNAIVRPY